MLDAMRTTLTLDDDVLASARALAAQRGVPIGTIISELARRGLASTQPAAIRNGIRLFPKRPDAGPVTPELVKTLVKDVD
jgi:predicted DNA-binding ribbon-helix-helix protein